MQPGTPYMIMVARNVRIARAAVTPPLSQSDVADRMKALGFSEWRRQTVGNTETGRRRLTVEEAAGLCVALETDLTALVYPPADGQPVSLPGGREIVFPAGRHFWNKDTPSVWRGNESLLPDLREESNGAR